MENIEEVVMKIIAYGGEAKGLIYSALDHALNDNKEEAYQNLKDAKEKLAEVHSVHAQLLSEINLDEVSHQYMFLLMHAEDIFMSSMSECEIVNRLISNRK